MQSQSPCHRVTSQSRSAEEPAPHLGPRAGGPDLWPRVSSHREARPTNHPHGFQGHGKGERREPGAREVVPPAEVQRPASPWPPGPPAISPGALSHLQPCPLPEDSGSGEPANRARLCFLPCPWGEFQLDLSRLFLKPAQSR